MKFNFLTVDNFYQDPDAVRRYALALNYPEPDAEHTYPGRNSQGIFYDGEIHQQLELMVARRLKYPTQNQAGYFRYSLAGDKYKQYIHVDPGWDVAGVLYLNPPTQVEPQAGTSFWMHKRLGMERVPANATEAAVYGFNSYDSIREHLIYGDGLDAGKWERYALVPMRYNRLVLFDPMLWHSHNENFGSTLATARLVQLFFLNYA
jgi:hypothetical protein